MRILLIVLVALGAICSAGYSLAAGSAKPNTAFTQSAPPKRSEPPMNFLIVRDSSQWCEPTCPEWISAEGKIEANTANKLARLLQNPALRKLPLVLHSGGGSINAALAMGRMVRAYKMDTAVGQATLIGCAPRDRDVGKCKPRADFQAFDGTASAGRAYCGSACPLVLLGGMHRVVDPSSLVGLHEPVAISQPYTDRYRVTYRMVHGKKQIISKTFVKRTYLAKRTEVGISPRIRGELTSYLNAMGGSVDIISEMGKAAPTDMNWISYASGDREKLGLVTANFRRLDMLIGVKVCSDKGVLASNCVHLKIAESWQGKPFDR